MKFTFAGKEYVCEESQKGEYVKIYNNGSLKTVLAVSDIQEAKLSLFPSSFVLAYIEARKNNP